jgi:hypothetical protein
VSLAGTAVVARTVWELRNEIRERRCSREPAPPVSSLMLMLIPSHLAERAKERASEGRGAGPFPNLSRFWFTAERPAANLGEAVNGKGDRGGGGSGSWARTERRLHADPPSSIVYQPRFQRQALHADLSGVLLGRFPLLASRLPRPEIRRIEHASALAPGGHERLERQVEIGESGGPSGRVERRGHAPSSIHPAPRIVEG